MATAQQTAAKNPTQAMVEANVALLNTVVEAGYKAQTRSLNVARVFVEAAGRQQQNRRKLVEQLANPALPWFSPERFSAFTNVLVENQNEMLRVGREYIDELNAVAAESRQTIETIVKVAGKAREAQQALLGEGLAGIREYANNFRAPAAAPQA